MTSTIAPFPATGNSSTDAGEVVREEGQEERRQKKGEVMKRRRVGKEQQGQRSTCKQTNQVAQKDSRFSPVTDWLSTDPCHHLLSCGIHQ